ncbi:MAG: PIN domain-containing protein [Gammaproteobacteria bacterium]|nr:PIN domain-containing protein [Gammaproteobacteria bacterium]
MQRVFVDTSAWFAFVNRADREHQAVASVLSSFRGRLVTSNAVFGETVTLCLHRLGHETARAVGETLRGSRQVDLVCLEPDDEAEAWRLFCRPAEKLCSFTDCSSFALMRRLRLETAVALDEGFAHEGFTCLPESA